MPKRIVTDRNHIFPFSFRVCRKNRYDPSTYEKEIYKGFGLNHKSTTTSIYVSALNSTGKSSVCQPIGEAISLLKDIIISADKGTPIAIYKIDSSQTRSFIEINIPQDYRDNGVVPEDLYRYRVLKTSNGNIVINAIDGNDWLMQDDFQINGEMHYHPLTKLLPIFTLLLIEHKVLVPDFSNTIENFARNPTIEAFVRIHEDFYNIYKNDEYQVLYDDISYYKNVLSDLSEKSFHEKVIVNTINQNPVTKKHVIIKQFDKNTFTQEQQRYIPKLPSEIKLPEEYRSFCNAVFDGAATAILFHGPSGTGKSMLCKLICQTINLPVMQTINCSENLDEFIFGKYIPKEEKIIFHENPITEAVRNGGSVIFEELNFAKPQQLAFMHSLLDDNGFITLDDGSIIKRHPNFRLFATMNDGYFGTKELNQATLNRFNYIKEVPELSDEAIKNMLAARVPQYASLVDQMLQVYKSIKSKAESEDIDIVISPRNLENWAKIAQYEGFITAAKSTILPVAKMDRKLEQAILGIINTHKWAA